MKVETTMNFDTMRELEEVSFLLGGKKYVIPPITYALLIKISELDSKLDKAIEENDLKKVVDISIQISCVAIPTITTDILQNTASVSEIKKIGRLIKESISGKDGDPELEFYREKYEDEYRKNFTSTKEKESKLKK